MPWTQLVVAFFAGYGLMCLILWALAVLWRLSHRVWSVSALLLAGNDEARVEGILRALHCMVQEGRLAEIAVAVDGEDETRAIVQRLAADLDGVRLLPAGFDPAAASRTMTGDTVWLIDLRKIPPRSMPDRPAWLRAGRRRGRRD